MKRMKRMKRMKLKTYTCLHCRKDYQSTGEKKPYCYNKDGNPFRCYDSKIYCSRNCYRSDKKEKLLSYYRNHPEVEEQRRQKISNYYKNHPDKLKEKIQKHQITLKNNPDIMKHIIAKRDITLLNHPEINKQRARKLRAIRENRSQQEVKEINKKHKRTLKEHPEIDINREIKRQATLKLNPNYKQDISQKVKRTLKEHPEILKRSIEKRKETIRNNPEIIINAINKQKKTLSNNPNIIQNKIKKYKETIRNNPEILKIQNKHRIESKRLNKTFNTSRLEDNLYKLLLTKYSDVKRNYNLDPRYPYMCDFYIPSKDLFIELQASWTHGRRPFIANDASCQEQLNTWKQKASISNYYKNAIETWTKRDVLKRQTAEKNNLNYIEIWNIRDI